MGLCTPQGTFTIQINRRDRQDEDHSFSAVQYPKQLSKQDCWEKCLMLELLNLSNTKI